MIYREVGNTGLKVSAIGLGGHEFLQDGRSKGFNEDFALAITKGHVFDGFGQDSRRRVLALAYDHGINVYDATQDSEKEALGRNLREMPPPFPVYVQTRPEEMMYDRDPGNRRMADYRQLKAEVERILRLMRLERLDFLNLGITPEAFQHDPDYLARLKATTDRLKQDGLIRFTSADTFRGEAVYLRQIASGGFDTIFINLNVADRAGTLRVLPEARAAGMGVMGREVFMKGELFRMGAEGGVTDRSRLAQAALRWALALPELTCMMVGADRTEHLAASLAVIADPRPSDEDLALIAAVESSALYRSYEAQRRREFLEEAPPARL